MKLIKPSVEYIPQESGLDGMYKQIERCGRVCYKSEDKITDTSAKGFVDRMIKSDHTAMLEHGTVYLRMDVDYTNRGYLDFGQKYHHNPYSKLVIEDGVAHVTTNYRVLIQNEWLDDLQYVCEPSEYHKKRYAMKFITDIGVCRELLRHRVFSFANESTRYCNYSKEKFDSQVTFVIPSWVDDIQVLEHVTIADIESNSGYFLKSLADAETAYLSLLHDGLRAEEARQVLPLATKTELVMTGFEDDWKHFFDLRLRGTTGKPHPDMLVVAQLAWNEFKDKLNLEL